MENTTPHTGHIIGKIQVNRVAEACTKESVTECQDPRLTYSYLPREVLDTIVKAYDVVKTRQQQNESEELLIQIMYDCPLIFQKILLEYVEKTEEEISTIDKLNKINSEIYKDRVLPAHDLFHRIAGTEIHGSRFAYKANKDELEEKINSAVKVSEKYKNIVESKMSEEYS